MEGIGRLPIIVIALAAWTVNSVLGQQIQAAGDQNMVSFLAPGRSVQAGALQQLGGQNQSPANQPRVGSSPAERGQPSWGAYLTSTDTEDVSNGPTGVRPRALMPLWPLMHCNDEGFPCQREGKFLHSKVKPGHFKLMYRDVYRGLWL